jgi:hypothetical protein
MGLFSRKKEETHPVIDLRQAEPATATWGSPMPCPACSGRGYLDHIDPDREVMYLHCMQCHAKYDVARTDMIPTLTSERFTI